MKRTVIKSIILLIIFIVLGVVYNIADPVISNEVALHNLNGGNQQFAQLTILNDVKNLIPFFFILIALIIFKKELKLILTKIKEKMKHEKKK